MAFLKQRPKWSHGWVGSPIGALGLKSQITGPPCVGHVAAASIQPPSEPLSGFGVGWGITDKE